MWKHEAKLTQSQERWIVGYFELELVIFRNWPCFSQDDHNKNIDCRLWRRLQEGQNWGHDGDFEWKHDKTVQSSARGQILPFGPQHKWLRFVLLGDCERRLEKPSRIVKWQDFQKSLAPPNLQINLHLINFIWNLVFDHDTWKVKLLPFQAFHYRKPVGKKRSVLKKIL